MLINVEHVHWSLQQRPDRPNSALIEHTSDLWTRQWMLCWWATCMLGSGKSVGAISTPTSWVAWHGYHGDQTHRAAIPRLCPLFPIQTCVCTGAEPSCCTFSKTNRTASIYYLPPIANINVLRMFFFFSKSTAYLIFNSLFLTCIYKNLRLQFRLCSVLK